MGGGGGGGGGGFLVDLAGHIPVGLAEMGTALAGGVRATSLY